MPKCCVVCKNLESKVVFREFDIDVVQCTRCGHVYSFHEADQNHDGYFAYEGLQRGDLFWWDEAHKEMYGDFCRRFIAGRSGKLLDVGCGLGHFVKRVSAFPLWEVLGYEISGLAVKFARERLGLKNIFQGRVEESNFEKKSFDIITLWDVIEHIPAPDPFLSYLCSLIRDDGMLFIHTPNVESKRPMAKIRKRLKGIKPGIHYLDARDHMNIYSMKTIAIVLRRVGFDNVEFTHLRPIQSLSGSKSQFLRFLKNLCYYSATGLHWITLGRVNLDNLFVIARKRPH